MKNSRLVGLLVLISMLCFVEGSGINRRSLSSVSEVSLSATETGTKSANINYTVTLTTSMGTIVIGLFDDMPITTGNFQNLTHLGYYDGTIFHRVVRNFVIQGGDLSKKGIVVPTIPDELPNKHSNVRGSVAMAKTTQPNSATSQFYINLVNNTYLDTNYSVFGQVIQGMDVVDNIGNVPTDINDRPLQDVTVQAARIIVAHVFVSPSSQTVLVGDSLVVNVNIADVSDLYGWEFKLFYPRDVLNGTSVAEGPFLKSIESLTFFFITDFTDDFNDTYGLVHVLCLRTMPGMTGVDGSGTLVTIEFKALAPTNSALLRFVDIHLSDHNAARISFKVSDGTVTVNHPTDTIPPQIFVVGWLPMNPFPLVPSFVPRPGEQVSVTANVSEELGGSGLDGVVLHYRVDGDEWANVSMTFMEDTWWNTTMPGQPGSSIVEFYVTATDKAGNPNSSGVDSYIVSPPLLGDINGDGKVDMRDVGFVARHFGDRNP